MTVIWKTRLQRQPVGRVGVDRLVTFLSHDTPDRERRRKRGVVIYARDLRQAKRKYRELEGVAEEAIYAGQVSEFLDLLDQRIKGGASESPRFGVFVEDDWVPHVLTGGGLTESQIASDLSLLENHLKPFFGGYSLREIDSRAIDRYKAMKATQKHQYGEGYSSSSVNNQLSLLRRILGKAEEYELLARNPIGPRTWVKRDSTPEDSKNWWRPEEEERAFVFLQKWRTEHPLRRIVIMVQLITAMRFSELRALEASDLDFDIPGIWIRRSMARKKIGTPKNKRARFQVIPRELAVELQAWLPQVRGQLLFAGPSGGPLANSTLNRWYKLLCDEAKVRRISSHGARHTAGSSYAVMGAGQKMVARILGHSDTQATERYTHIQVDATRSLVDARWERLSGGDKSE